MLVVGGGIGGIQTSLDLAESGFKVYLLEKNISIGGTMAQLDKTFPTNDCSMCIMSPKLVDAGRHRNIEILTNAKVEKVEGEPGHFKVLVHKKARSVTLEDCKACGDCAKVCPVRIPNDYEQGLGHPRGRLPALCPGHAERLWNRKAGNSPLPRGLPSPRQCPGVRRPDLCRASSRRPSPSSGKNCPSPESSPMPARTRANGNANGSKRTGPSRSAT